MATTTVSVPMEDDLRERIAGLASEEERDLASQIRYMCKKFFEEGVIHLPSPTIIPKPRKTAQADSSTALEALTRFDVATPGADKKRALEEAPDSFPAALQERARSIVVGEGRAAERRDKLEALILDHAGHVTPGLNAAKPSAPDASPVMPDSGVPTASKPVRHKLRA